jgi:hypothetical protein
MKICLCGSTRFMDQFNAANVAMSLAGHIVYSVATSTKGDFKPTEDQKIALDAVHLRKIQESDAVLVVGIQEDGSLYIGDSTRREIMYAHIWDKTIGFWDPSKDVIGPFTEFQDSLKQAATTNAEREAAKAQERARRAEMLESFGLLKAGHTGQDDCPECAKEDAEESERSCH